MAYYLNLFLHILAALIWVGGLFFVVLVLRPVVGKLEPQSLQGKLFDLVGKQFRLVGWIALAVLVVTGLLNLHFRGIGTDHLASVAFWRSGWGTLLAIKLSLVAIVLISSYLHDFRLAPALTQKLQEPSISAEALNVLRKRVSWLARINGLLVLGIVAFAMFLARGGS